MHKRLMAFLNDQKILCKKQFGFQKTFSTGHAKVSLIDSIEKVMENNLFICGILLIYKKHLTP